jgi:hypothetical protein
VGTVPEPIQAVSVVAAFPGEKHWRLMPS